MRFESTFQLFGHTIRNVSVKNDFVCMNDEDDLLRKIDFFHEISDKHINDTCQAGNVLLTVRVDIKKKEGRRITNRFESEVKIEGYFAGPVSMEESLFHQMLNINGAAALYSVARGFFVSLSSQVLHEGRILLPLVNFIERQESASEYEDTPAK